MRWRERGSSWWSACWRALVVGVLYYVAYRYAVFLRDPDHLGASFWPGAGIVVTALLLTRRSHWPALLATVAAVQFGSALSGGVEAAIWTTAGNLLVAVTAAWLLQRWRADRLVDITAIMRFVVAVVAATVLGGVVGAVGILSAGTPFSYWLLVAQWIAGDSVGILTMTPALLVLADARARRRLFRVEALAILVAVAVVAGVVFGTDTGPMLYLALLPLVVAALRLGMPGAAIATFLAAQILNFLHAAGYGAIASFAQDGDDARWQVQLFLATVTLATLGFAALLDELSSRDEVERVLKHQAHHDVLTGLPNRAALASHLEQVLDGSGGPVPDVRLLLCDLDDFKEINDRLGHHAGDEALVAVAERLRSCIRPGDVLVRLSGDEFVIVLEGADEQVVDALTDRLLARMRDPITIDAGEQVTVGMSIGIARTTPGHDAQTLLREADAAMYRAKERGRGAAERFDDRMRAAREGLALPQELRDGLARDELFVRFQPAVDLASGHLFAFESLVRWQHPTRGLLPPERFLSVTGSTGLRGELFTYVLQRSLDAQHRWATHLGFHPPVSVNLSARELADPGLVSAVAVALTRTGTSPDTLWLEVTEGAVADRHALGTLADLHDLGVHLAIDDFGTGRSSMTHWAEVPWELVKIDRDIIARLGDDPSHERLVRAVILMAHSLGIRTLAKGVETPEQLVALRSMECDIAQGWVISAPLDAHDAAIGLTPDGRYGSGVELPGLATEG
ncbi:EAL domain-containing protein [Egibacter rhizosphaerae]|uniref:EAL domain-containing protein n=1 Tax=Egibacter rhizosphaerae TaxID=1670831 RepID=A0A411YIW6_9ACTN|nr:EAL domain-containing protein [Egibacter rhizosphaerae]QBI21069.1 EAL domain-containing protein [Egibacter rhizosphaerae]